MASAFAIDTYKKENKAVLKIKGDITSESEDKMNTAFDSLLNDDQKNFVLDLSEADYVNSAGIAIIIGFLNQANNVQGSLKMAGLNDHLQKVIETVGLNDFIAIFDSIDQALAS